MQKKIILSIIGLSAITGTAFAETGSMKPQLLIAPAPTGNVGCTKEYKPVCGSEITDSIKLRPKTYSNECVAKKARAKVLYKGKCKAINAQVRKVQQAVKVEKKKIREFKKQTTAEIKNFRQGVKAEVKEVRRVVKDKKQEYGERLRNAETEEEKEAIRAEIKVDKENLKELKEKRVKKLQKKRKNYLKRKLDLVEKRLATYISKFEQIHSRITERVKILEDQDYDMSAVKELNVKVKEYLNVALQDLKDFRELIRKALTAETPEDLKEVLKEARKELKSAKENVKNAYRAIKEAIQKIKKIVRVNEQQHQPEELSSTPTPSTDNQDVVDVPDEE